MTTKELLDAVYKDIDSRNLKQPRIRKNAADKIVMFMETTGQFLSGTQVVFPTDRSRVREKYEEFKGKQLNGAEKNVVKIMNDILSFNPMENSVPVCVRPSRERRQVVLPMGESIADIHQIETKLVNGSFRPIDSMEHIVPNSPGLYCIKLRNSAALPGNIGPMRDDRIIYIGKASKSLYERLWEEELNCERPATFFRSIGAMLGYLPPKGSLYGKSSKNYKFDRDTDMKIKKWMRQSLLVNFVVAESTCVADVESRMIAKYRPLANIQGNPTASEMLKCLRAKCLEYARSIPD